MGERGSGNTEFRLDVAHDHALRSGGEQLSHDAKSGNGAHGRQHVGIAGDLAGRGLGFHSSTIAEIWKLSTTFCCPAAALPPGKLPPGRTGMLVSVFGPAKKRLDWLFPRPRKESLSRSRVCASKLNGTFGAGNAGGQGL